MTSLRSSLPTPLRTRLGRAWVAPLLLLTSLPASAATWLNNGTDWNDPANWNGSVVDNSAEFQGPAGVNPYLNASAQSTHLSFASDASGYHLSGEEGARLTLTSTRPQGTIASSSSGTNTISAHLVFSETVEQTPSINQGANGTLILSGPLSGSNATAGLNLTSQGTITLSGSNDYAGDTVLNGSGTFNINHEQALSSGTVLIRSNLNVTLSNTSGRAITLTQQNNVVKTGGEGVIFTSAAGTGDLSFGSGRLTLNGSSNRVVVTNLGSTLTVGSLDTTDTQRTVQIGLSTNSQTNHGRLLVTGTAGDGLNGTVRLAGGILEIGHHEALGTATLEWHSVQNHAGSPTFQVSREMIGTEALSNSIRLGNSNRGVGNATIGGSHAVEFKGSFTNHGTNRTLTVSNTATTTFSGDFYLAEADTGRTLTLNGSGETVISGAIANSAAGTSTASQLIYAGTGSLRLAGQNTYTGLTTARSGTLTVDGQIGTGGATINADATLAGRGTIGGATQVNGRLYTSFETGALQFGGNLTLASGAQFQFDGGDPVEVAGALSLSQPWTLTLAGNQFVDGGSTVILTFGTLTGTLNLNPTFDLSQLGITLSGDLSLAQVENSLVLYGITATAIPEPSTIGLSFLCFGGVMAWHWRARRRK